MRGCGGGAAAEYSDLRVERRHWWKRRAWRHQTSKEAEKQISNDINSKEFSRHKNLLSSVRLLVTRNEKNYITDTIKRTNEDLKCVSRRWRSGVI